MGEARVTLTEVLADIEELKSADSYWGSDKFNKKYENNFMKILNSFTEEEKGSCGELLLKSLESGNRRALDYITLKIFDKRKIIDWKDSPGLINQLFDTVTRKSIECKEDSSTFNDFLYKFFETLESNKISLQYSDKMFNIMKESFKHSDNPDATIHASAQPCMNHYPWVSKPERIPEYIKMLVKAVKNNPDLHEDHWYCSVCGSAINRIFRSQQGCSVHFQVLDDITEIFKFCADQEFKSSEDSSKQSLAYVILTGVMEDFLSCGSTKPELCKPMMGTIKELWDCGDNTLERDANYIITAFVDKPDIIGDDATTYMIKKFLRTEDVQLGCKLQQIYEKAPHLILPHLPEFTRILKNGSDDTNMLMITQMMSSIVKTNPEKIPAGTTDAIAGQLSHPNNMYYTFTYLEALAPHRPQEVLAHEATLIKMYKTSPETSMSMIGNLLAKVANTPDRQKQYLDLYAEKLGQIPPGVYQICVISNMRQVGQQNVEALKKYRPLFEKYKADPQLTDMCQATLDVIDGRSLQRVSSEVKAQKQEINQLDTRVTNNEGDIKDVKKDVNTNKINIGKVTEEVKGQGQRLDDLKQVVDETVERVDELDRKTLSHAPAWSRDVAKLLNVQSDCDWRLLASRLGYKAGDIQSWATQPDPCLSMLDEWFATHSTREATNAVKKNLIEINRTDASTFIDQALKSVGEPVNPLPIFISYQWAHQKEAKLLRKHLALAGYPAHMNVGQMGGGGGLFSNIDAGIRAAKVVICCVTQKYSESENCTKEVNLTTALGKQMIPLLMEKMSWPPPGSMGPIFGEYLFVRFFQRDATEQTRDERFWPPEKFQELLIQLRYNVAPEIDAVPQDSPYRNWWKPTQSAVKTNVTSSKGLPSVEIPEITSKQNNGTSPEVFISYQWDKQSEIKSLYRRLESLGYSCWLDIEQMGGGDSLYDKIDKGLRGSNVMISCVTEKYAKSANCRREVSLADALKKPIIPLKLEPGLKWPPEGPMSMVLTSLTPIDFTKYDPPVFQNWNCPEFEILHKALSHNLGRTALPLTSNQNNYQQSQQQQQQQSNQQQNFNSQSQAPQKQAQNQFTTGQQGQGQTNLGQPPQGHQGQTQQLQRLSQQQALLRQQLNNISQNRQSTSQKNGPYLVSYPRQKYY